MQYMASGSSSNQYAASASNQNQYAMSGQLPYGGGAEPRLQYCTPGSTEKGVCLNGVDSLEPTRTKRSTEMIQDMSNGIADYAKVAKKAASDVWDSVTAQPEVQYLMDVSRRITKDVSRNPYNVKSELSTPVDLLQLIHILFARRMPLRRWEMMPWIRSPLTSQTPWIR